MSFKYVTATAALFAAYLLTGCGSAPVKPETLAVPVKSRCFSLPSALEGVEIRGLMRFVWHTRLERGAYISVHENAQGTYFRGPPGGVRVYQPTMLHKPAGLGTHITYDGGVFVPRDGTQPLLYTYFSLEPVPFIVPPEGASCDSAVLVRNPEGKVGDGTAAVGGVVGTAMLAFISLDIGKIHPPVKHLDEGFNAKLAQAVRGARELHLD